MYIRMYVGERGLKVTGVNCHLLKIALGKW